MIVILLKRYWKALLTIAILIIIGWSIEGNFNDGMFMASCLGVLTVFGAIIGSAKAGSGKTAIAIIQSTISIFKWFWYIISLQPLRRWLSRVKVKATSPEPYPYLALYGSITDTQAMLANYSSAFWHDKTPAVRAVIWRLLARGVMEFSGKDDNVTIKLGEWKKGPSDGVDQALEMTVYRFLQQSVNDLGNIDPKMLYTTISYHVTKKSKKADYDFKNQYRFADLLSTSISKKDYSEKDTRNIYGMKKFLNALPESYENLKGTEGQLDLQRIWTEYMAYAYLFRMEQSTLGHLSDMMPASSQPQLLHLLTTSKNHNRLLQQLMNSATDATYDVDDIVATNRGRLKMAWHAEEVYDITTN